MVVLQALLPHELLYGASGGLTALPPQLAPDLARSVPPSAFIVDAPDRLEGFGDPFEPVGGFSGIAGDGGMRIMGRRSDRQDAADPLDSAAIQNRCPKIVYQRLFSELRMAGLNTGIISSRLFEAS